MLDLDEIMCHIADANVERNKISDTDIAYMQHYAKRMGDYISNVGKFCKTEMTEMKQFPDLLNDIIIPEINDKSKGEGQRSYTQLVINRMRNMLI